MSCAGGKKNLTDVVSQLWEAREASAGSHRSVTEVGDTKEVSQSSAFIGPLLPSS